jgi:hypothetical protein
MNQKETEIRKKDKRAATEEDERSSEMTTQD